MTATTSRSGPGYAESYRLQDLLEGIDHGIESHLAWNRRLLRFALVRESPGNDVVHPDAHAFCQFGVWFTTHRRALGAFDEELAERVAAAHRSMHDAARAMCDQVLQGRGAADADLQAYERGQSEMVSLLNELRQRVAQAATHYDPLTGLPLRHGLEYAFGLRHKDARRGHAQFWLAMIDVDHFKSVNDRHGHTVGDVVLRHIAGCLAACIRETDTLFRFGGEEFLALLLLRDQRAAESLSERMLDAVSAAPLTIATGATLHFSVTIGLARVRADEDLSSATERADQAMLLGKAAGRARWVVAPD